MELNYERAKHLKGKMIRFRNKNGEMVVGKVVNVKKDGLEIAELGPPDSNEGYGFGFFDRPFFRRPFFFPFVEIEFFPFFFF